MRAWRKVRVCCSGMGPGTPGPGTQGRCMHAGTSQFPRRCLLCYKPLSVPAPAPCPKRLQLAPAAHAAGTTTYGVNSPAHTHRPTPLAARNQLEVTKATLEDAAKAVKAADGEARQANDRIRQLQAELARMQRAQGERGVCGWGSMCRQGAGKGELGRM